MTATRVQSAAEVLALAWCSRPVDGKPCEVCQPRAARLVEDLARHGMVVVPAGEASRCFLMDHEGRLAYAEESDRQAQTVLARVRALAEDWKNTPPLDEIDWEFCDPNAGHRSAARQILAALDGEAS